MQIPSTLKPVVDAYHKAGQLTGILDRIELDKQSATDCLNNLKDEFKHCHDLCNCMCMCNECRNGVGCENVGANHG